MAASFGPILGDCIIPILGAHMSIAGGYYRAAERAAEEGCDCVQLFTKNNNQWRAKPITREEVRAFQAALEEHQLSHPLSHASYLINLGSPDVELWRQSRDAFLVELRRAEQLGIPYVVLHPGAFTTSTEAKGIAQVAKALNQIHRRAKKLTARCLLETTAGQGSCLGWRFQQLEAIFQRLDAPERVGVCLDTCHLFAAGYPMHSAAEYRRTVKQMDETIGIEQVKAIHLNDSKRPLGSRVDRHENIGEGEMGLEPFRRLLHDKRFADVPMYLETPKGDHASGESWDRVNLQTLRQLAAGK